MFRSRTRRRTVAADPRGSWAEQNARDLFSYEMLVLQQAEEHAHMWQTPALALTAQAFLLTVSLDDSITAPSRLVAAGLGALVALLSVQLMTKHQFHLLLDRWKMSELERNLDIVPISDRGWAYHVPQRGDYTAPAPHLELQGLRGRSASAWWLRGLWTFLAVNLGIAVWVGWPWLVDGAEWIGRLA